jgi:hypothetical protein
MVNSAAGSRAVFGINSSTTGTGIYGQASSATSSSTGTGVLGESLSTSNSSTFYGVRGNATGGSAGRGVGGIAGSGGTGIYGMATGAGTGVLGEVSSTTAVAVRGENAATGGTNPAVGVKGTSSGQVGRGVWGVATTTATNGPSYGVYGSAASAIGYGVYGTNTNAGGTGVVGEVSGAFGTAISGRNTSTSPDGDGTGVYGSSLNPTGRAIWGEHLGSGAGFGVYGQTASATAHGVFGVNTAGAAATFGVRGESSGTSTSSTAGVYGLATATTGGPNGVYGHSNAVNGTGIQGACNGTGAAWGVWGHTSGAGGADSVADAAVGVIGIASSAHATNFHVGVYGESPETDNGYAGYFNGKVNVTGTLSKGGGSFKIDHPLDPENRYLYHSFVESPDMKNIYDGVVTLNAVGEAVVRLPEYFEALNRDFRYQLTCIGQHAPVYVAEEIHLNVFKISGGRPGMKVSWQVTGTRQDAFANAHRIPVEEDKPPEGRGLYMHPEAFGRPAEEGIARRNAKVNAAQTQQAVPIAQPIDAAAGADLLAELVPGARP